MNSSKTWSPMILPTVLSIWLITVTAAMIMVYQRSSRCDDCKRYSQDIKSAYTYAKQQTNLSTDELLKDLVTCLEGHFKSESDARVRRALPDGFTSASFSTLLLNFLKSLIQETLENVCGSSDKVCLPGPKGPKGEQGLPGWPGYKGERGSGGEPGRQGRGGRMGPMGVKGVQGQKGDMGVRGPEGDTGRKGERGFKGEKGNAGEKGSMGSKGEVGPPGYKGEKGITGSIGLPGVKGGVGSGGLPGQKGEKGERFPIPLHLLPSECSHYDVLDEPWRNVSVTNDGNNAYCDQSAMSPGWKRFSDSIGGAMPENCPYSDNLCGTHAPGWLNGIHPSTVGETTNMEVCFYYSGSCCNWQTYIDVTNCDLYYVYNLPSPPACSLVYCSNG
jgi:hypothetical protein